ncbi:pyridoxal-phosphate dependent enzyme [bacterium]|nr:pyridoxal-phosphate dependent enzyme [bacterium]
MPLKPNLSEIQSAYKLIAPHIHKTPVLTSSAIDEKVGANVFFKCENLQKVGAFKIRGASNAVFGLSDEEAQRGVVTHSSGNHAAAVALAARWRKIPAYIVMPETSPQIKQKAVAGYGGKITLCGSTPRDREEAGQKLIEKTGAHFIPAYNDEVVIAGQGTVALEILEQIPDLDILITPLGGGGLTGGVARVIKEFKPSIHMVGAEPEAVDDAYRSKLSGKIVTIEKPCSIADGLLMPLGEKTFPLIYELVDEIILAPERQIIEAMRLIYERMKIIIEPSSAVPLAALLDNRLDAKGRRVCIVLSGGNVDLSAFFEWLRSRIV